jgi:CRISPR/Cas system-associated exonuclease Cas4 (RecB family)
MATTLIQRVFLGWEAPFLPNLARSLVARHKSSRAVDMAQVRIALPGGNAVRRLLELLAQEAEKDGKILFHPQIFTAGSLFEHVLPSATPLASDAARILAWMAALKATPKERLQILAAEIPELSDFRSWLALAERVDKLHIEVAGAGITFAEVAQRGAELASFLDEERWEVLNEIAISYGEELAQHGVVDDYSDRIVRLNQGKPIALAGPLYLAGLAELNQNQRDLVALINTQVEAFIFAPAEESENFDVFGCVRAELWSERVVDLQEQMIMIAESPRDVVARMVQELTRLSSHHSASDIVIGLGDESEASYFKGSLAAAEIPVRVAGGTPFSATSLGLYLRGVHQYLSSKTFTHFAAIAKHPYQQALLFDKLPEHAVIALIIDRYQERHFQATISPSMPGESASDQEFFTLVSALHEALADLQGPPLSLLAWVPVLQQFLLKLAPVLTTDDILLLDALEELLTTLALSDEQIELRGAEALLMFLHLADSKISIPDAALEAVELLGWLELALDDAPALIVTSLDENIVPAVINADPFLPNTLRRHLGLVDNARRLGRDLFLFSTMVHSKSDFSIVLARRSLDGNPRFPSRLLLACKSQELPQRIAHLYQEGRRFHIVRALSERATPPRWQLSEPVGLKGIVKTMSVTSFKDYLVCPYRFYLRHVLKTKEYPGELFELDALNFGTLAHLVLDRFARDKEASSHNAETIYETLNLILTGVVSNRFGRHEYPAIRVQIEQLRERLRHFSYWQADQNRQGWKIASVEHEITPEQCVLKLSQSSMGIRGRIDRIDHHPKSNQYRIIDYKTADAGQNLKYVLKNKTWLDLQMPLYYHAVRDLYHGAELNFFYFNLSAHTAQEQLVEVGAESADFEAGIEQACLIAESVAEGVFWPPSSKTLQDSYNWVIGSLEPDDSSSDEVNDE